MVTEYLPKTSEHFMNITIVKRCTENHQKIKQFNVNQTQTYLDHPELIVKGISFIIKAAVNTIYTVCRKTVL